MSTYQAKALQRAITSGSEPKRQTHTGNVVSLVTDSQHRLVGARVTLNTSQGVSSPVYVSVPPGIQVNQGQTVKVVNIGSPSFAIWSLHSIGGLNAAGDGGIVSGGAVTHEFDSIWIKGSGNITVGGEYDDTEGSITGPYAVLDRTGLFGYGASGRITFAAYWQTYGLNNRFSPGDVMLGNDKDGGPYIWSSPEKEFVAIGSDNTDVVRFERGGGFVKGVLTAGEKTGPQVQIGIIPGDNGAAASIVARNVYNVPEFMVRTGDQAESVHVHIGKPKPSPGYLEFKDGELTVDGRVSAREFYLIGEGSIAPGSSLVNEGRIQVGTGELAAVLDGQDPTWRIYAGADVPGSAPFRVNKWGDAYLRNAVIDSAVFADYAEIGGWRIGATTASGDSADDILSDDGGNVLSASGHYLVSAGGGVILNGSDNSISIMSEEFGQPGVQLQWNNGSPRAYIGNGADRYFRWTGNNLAWKGANTELTEAGLFVAQNAQIAGQITATSGAFTGAVYVGASAPRVVIDGAAKEIRSENFASGAAGWRIGPTGDAEFNNLVARGSIVTAVFQKSLVTAFAGSQIVAKSASTLHEACTVNGSAFPLKVKKQDGAAPFAAGDIVHLKDGALSTWATVDAGSDGGDHWAYTATYQSGNSIGQYRAGHAVVDYGQSGDGFVVITADQSGAPYLSVRTHAGQPWNTVTERARLGNLSGIGGASGYGLWTDNGYFTGTVYANAGQIGQWSIAGGNLTAANARIKASVPSIELGDATGYDAGGAGVWLGNDGGVYKARIGRKPSDGYGYLAWTGTSLIFRADNMGGNVNQSIDVGTAGHIKGGATGYNAGTGFWLGYDSGAYKFYVGNAAGNYLRWTGSALEVKGAVDVTQGNILGSVDVGTAGHIKGGATGYDTGAGFWLGYDGAYKFRIGDPAGQYMRWTGSNLEIKGTVYSASGNIGGFTISDNMLYAIDTNAQIGLHLKAGTTPCIYGNYSHSRIAFYFDGISIYGGANEIRGFTYIDYLYAGVVSNNVFNLIVDQNGVGFFNTAPVGRPPAYTFTNGATDRTIDCANTTLQELANVVYTLWNDLRNYGLLA